MTRHRLTARGLWKSLFVEVTFQVLFFHVLHARARSPAEQGRFRPSTAFLLKKPQAQMVLPNVELLCRFRRRETMAKDTAMLGSKIGRAQFEKVEPRVAMMRQQRGA
jgi:hypothetical protein